MLLLLWKNQRQPFPPGSILVSECTERKELFREKLPDESRSRTDNAEINIIARAEN